MSSMTQLVDADLDMVSGAGGDNDQSNNVTITFGDVSDADINIDITQKNVNRGSHGHHK